MKYLPFFILTSFWMFSACTSEPNTAQKQLKMKELHWLIGEWQRTNEKPERTSIEIWGLHEEGHLEGIGLTTEGDEVVFKEKLSLNIEGGKVQYTATVPHNSEPTVFEMTSSEKNKMVFENPEHDFPKKIMYEQTAKNSMQATVSGNGKTAVFYFKKLN